MGEGDRHGSGDSGVKLALAQICRVTLPSSLSERRWVAGNERRRDVFLRSWLLVCTVESLASGRGSQRPATVLGWIDSFFVSSAKANHAEVGCQRVAETCYRVGLDRLLFRQLSQSESCRSGLSER